MKELLLYGNQSLANNEILVEDPSTRHASRRDIQASKAIREPGFVLVDSQGGSKTAKMKGTLLNKGSQTMLQLENKYARELLKKDRWFRRVTDYRELMALNDTTGVTTNAGSGVTNIEQETDEYQYGNGCIKFDIDPSAGDQIEEYYEQHRIGVSLTDEESLYTGSMHSIEVAHDFINNRIMVYGFATKVGGDQYFFARCVKVDGENISYGDLIEIYDPGASINTGPSADVVFDPDSETFVFFYHKETTDYLYCKTATVDASLDITLGSEVAIHTSGAVTNYCADAKNDNSELILFFQTGSTLYAKVGSIASGTITFGSNLTVTTTCNELYDACMTGWEYAVAVYKSSSDNYAYRGVVRVSSPSANTLILSGNVLVDNSFSASSGAICWKKGDPNDRYVVMVGENNSTAYFYSATGTSATGTGVSASITNTGVEQTRMTYMPLQKRFFCPYGNGVPRFISVEIDGNTTYVGTPTLVDEYVPNSKGMHRPVWLEADGNIVNVYEGVGEIYLDVMSHKNGIALNNVANTADIHMVYDATDMSDVLETGSFGVWVYFPEVRGIAGINLRVGSSSSNYYEKKGVLRNYEGRLVEQGWNYFVIKWSDMDEVGTIIPTAFTYAGVTLLTTQFSDTYDDIKIDGVTWNNEDAVINYKATPIACDLSDRHYDITMAEFTYELLLYEGEGFETFERELHSMTTVSSPYYYIDYELDGGVPSGFRLELKRGSGYPTFQTIRVFNPATGESIVLNKQDIYFSQEVVIDTENKIARSNERDEEMKGAFFKIGPGKGYLELYVTNSDGIGAYPDYKVLLYARKRYK